jgi:hypothetical protein
MFSEGLAFAVADCATANSPRGKYPAIAEIVSWSNIKSKTNLNNEIDAPMDGSMMRQP